MWGTTEMSEEKKCEDELLMGNNEKIPLLYSGEGKKNYTGGEVSNFEETRIKSSSILLSPLVEASKNFQKPNGSILGDEVARAILPRFPTFASAIPLQLNVQNTRRSSNGTPTARAAVSSIDGRLPISHQMIHSFITVEFGSKLHELGYGRGDRVALVLPNGPELALAILCTVHWASCVPLNAFGAHTELMSDLKACGADLVIGLSGAASNSFQHVQDIARDLGIPFVGLEQSQSYCGIFKLAVPPGNETSIQNHRKAHSSHANEASHSRLRNEYSDRDFQLPNAHEDEVMVLFTSGTTGSKKLVSHLLGEILVATAVISVSWKLTSEDVNCNLMPLFHVGGIVRQVFSPVLSGGCVICCPSFDPLMFWSLLEEKKFNWYYAAPTMHQLILQTKKENNYVTTHKLRMIANAAGGLLPSLARELRDTFSANVLPSYGMTECMPISSPPFSYQLERPGTSGVPVGPEVAIINVSNNAILPPLTEGQICVRGFPCFHGYSPTTDDGADFDPKSSFLSGGWFNTGDLGYLDNDGYLYITGRSKEVINRGGEIISPMEVEEAVISHPDVVAAIAFSAEHDVLQEVVGIAIVSPPNRPRLDLQSLHEFLGDSGLLTAPKWPQCLVFMNELPKSNTNKLLRVKLGERLNLPVMTDSIHPVERTFEAECPPQGSAMNLPILSWPVPVDPQAVGASLLYALRSCVMDDKSLEPIVVVVEHESRKKCLVCYFSNVNIEQILEVSEKSLNRYDCPSYFVFLETVCDDLMPLPPPSKQDSIQAIRRRLFGSPDVTDALVIELQGLFNIILDLDYLPHPDSNFFNLGGSSMLASKLATAIRKEYGISFSGSEVFAHTTCSSLAEVIREHQEKGVSNGVGGERNSEALHYTFEKKRLNPISPGWMTMLLQSLPLFLLFPVYTMTQYILLLGTLLLVLTSFSGNDIPLLIAALCVYKLFIGLGVPLLFVFIKWSVIGRYKAGSYRVYGSYYLRWWFVEICRKLFGRGLFGSHGRLLNLYYRLLGAKIGEGAKISTSCEIAEFDLITVGEYAALEQDSICRGFSVDNGCMMLGTVSVGKNSSLGTKSIVAPNSQIPDRMHLGPQMSSYDIRVEKCNEPSNAKYNKMTFSAPNNLFTFIGYAIVFFVQVFSQIPMLMVWYCLLTAPWQEDEKFDTVGHAFQWLCDFRRIPLYLGIRYCKKFCEPLLFMFASIVLKRTIIGKFKAGPRGTSQYQLLRYWLVNELFQKDKVQAVTDLIGRHFELVSCMYRLLGAKVGKRVFWPGTHIKFSGEYDLLEIGDDVVFGSRSTIMCGDRERLAKVRLCAGANVADNCVVLPGATIGKNAVLGAYGLCPADWCLPESSVWFGSKNGEPVMLGRGVTDGHDVVTPMQVSDQNDVASNNFKMTGDETTLRPFGKAFYKREATFYVLPLWLLIPLGIAIALFVCTVHAFPLIGAIQLSGAILYGARMSTRDYSYDYSLVRVFVIMLYSYCLTHLARLLMWFVIELGAKWALIGKREEGVYNWDTSSYAQRWEILQLFQKIRKMKRHSILDFMTGTPLMAAFFRLHGCKIGNDCCLWPTGGDPFPVEPELITIGDRCAIDDGRLVCHLNTKGNFELSPLVLEDDVTIRRLSKIQKGCVVEQGAMVLEHSLVLTGETVEAGSLWQGTPAVCIQAGV